MVGLCHTRTSGCISRLHCFNLLVANAVLLHRPNVWGGVESTTVEVMPQHCSLLPSPFNGVIHYSYPTGVGSGYSDLAWTVFIGGGLHSHLAALTASCKRASTFTSSASFGRLSCCAQPLYTSRAHQTIMRSRSCRTLNVTKWCIMLLACHIPVFCEAADVIN